MTDVDVDSLQAEQRPDTDVYQPDSGNHTMAHGRGLNPRTHRVLEHRSQQYRGQAYDHRHGDRSSEPPPSLADSKRNHRRKDATAGSNVGWREVVRKEVIRYEYAADRQG
ncbi:MAG TPA: hypothetical protein VI653_05485 [Steroidobacteraceae bacterium]